MARYRDDAKEKVRDAIDFVALVSAKTELRRTSGSGYMGLCPFHDERSPSFSVDGAKKVFHCFGCGESGDLYRFVELTEGVDFRAALELLADRHGIELELADEDPRAAERRRARERLLELLERTATFYERMLWDSREAGGARSYLAGRGLEEQTLRAFRVGYAPSAWDTVLASSRRAGYQARELYDAGLVARARGEGRIYDYFRARIMFPLADQRGRVLGFGARALRDNQRPKYLNTSEKRELFHKGSIVYAAHLARAAAARAGSVIVCEGYTDVLALHQAGVANAVASMGTALTEEQVVELGRMAPTIQLALDADDAGQEAMLRAAKVAAGRRLELRVVPLPEGRDPAEVALAEGEEAIRALVARSVPFVRFRVQRTLERADLSRPEGRDRVLADLRPELADVPPGAMREELIRVVTSKLDIHAEHAAALFGRRPTSASAPVRRSDPFARASRRTRAERAFLAACLALPSEGLAALRDCDADDHFSDPVARRAAAWLADHFDAPLDAVPEDDPELVALLSELVARAAAQPVRAATLEAERLQLELARVERQIATAQTGRRADLARRRAELQRQLGAAVERSLA